MTTFLIIIQALKRKEPTNACPGIIQKACHESSAAAVSRFRSPINVWVCRMSVLLIYIYISADLAAVSVLELTLLKGIPGKIQRPT